jgi:hypothetical protein
LNKKKLKKALTFFKKNANIKKHTPTHKELFMDSKKFAFLPKLVNTREVLTKKKLIWLTNYFEDTTGYKYI